MNETVDPTTPSHDDAISMAANADDTIDQPADTGTGAVDPIHADSQSAGMPDETSAQAAIVVGSRVTWRPGSAAPSGGVVVDDYDGFQGIGVHVGKNRIVDAARRWAVALDSGDLTFAETDELELAPPTSQLDE